MSKKTDRQPNIPPPLADIETASDDYATRFAGPSGQWLLWVQEQGTRHVLACTKNVHTILDVGGGHAQLTHVYLEKDHEVMVVGSAPTPGTRLEKALQHPNCSYIAADLLQLPFPHKHFHLVSSFRLLTHCKEWERLVEQLCKVSRTYVLLDYPTSQSINAIAPALFDAKKKVEKNTRYWRSFRHKEVDQVFYKQGFARVATYKQFFLPMALHRLLRCKRLSQLMERVARLCGLTRWLGSPVIALYQRKTKDD